MFLDYKPTRYEGKCFLRNLNIRIHKDITGEVVWGGARSENKILLDNISRFYSFL